MNIDDREELWEILKMSGLHLKNWLWLNIGPHAVPRCTEQKRPEKLHLRPFLGLIF